VTSSKSMLAVGLAAATLVVFVVVIAMGGALQFVQEEFARRYVPDFLPKRLERPAEGVEIGFLFDDVAAAYHRAIDAGCTSVAAPEKRPWGPTIAFVRDDEGVLVEMMQAQV
jgi:catechol 2,3-dioxygenase-like lactoylglutathione lyase family enzyme